MRRQWAIFGKKRRPFNAWPASLEKPESNSSPWKFIPRQAGSRGRPRRSGAALRSAGIKEYIMAFDYTSPTFITAAAIVIVLIIAAIVIYEVNRRHRTARFRTRFGTEYDLALQEFKSREK